MASRGEGLQQPREARGSGFTSSSGTPMHMGRLRGRQGGMSVLHAAGAGAALHRRE